MAARLPPYLLSQVLGYAVTVFDEDCSFLLRLGIVSKAFLEALTFVEFLHVDTLKPLRGKGRGSPALEYDGVLISHRYDARVKRWCEIASARLKNVSRMHDGGGYGCYFNAVQTRSIVDCAASFPNLTELEFYDCEPEAVCTSLAAHVRAGRFASLKHLSVSDLIPNRDVHGDLPYLYTHVSKSAAARQRIKLAMQDLLGQVPVNIALDMLIGGHWGGLYPWLLEADDEYDTWRAELFALIDNGADIIAYPTLLYMLDGLKLVPAEGFNEWDHAHLETAYSTIEAMLVRGADPNLSIGSLDNRNKQTPLSVIIRDLHSQIDQVQTYPMWRRNPEEIESLFRMLMRIIDLLLRHGADDPRPDLYEFHDYRSQSNVDYGPWILQRADCTPLLRQDVLRRRSA